MLKPPPIPAPHVPFQPLDVTLQLKPRDPLSQWLLSDPQVIHSSDTVTWDAAKRRVPTNLHSSSSLDTQKSLVEWSNDPLSGPIRWLSGRAGAGKTTVAQQMAEYWAQQGRLAGSFFFSWDGEKPYATGAQWLPGTIAYQLLKSYEISFPEVDRDFSSFPCCWSDIVHGLSHISPIHPLVIVIDGFDECYNKEGGTDQQLQLLGDILAFAHQLAFGIKILITCRPEPHLEKMFHKFAEKLGPFYHICLDQSSPNDGHIPDSPPVSLGQAHHGENTSFAFNLCLTQRPEVLPLPASIFIPLSVDEQSPTFREINETLSEYHLMPKARCTSREWFESEVADLVAAQATWKSVKLPTDYFLPKGHKDLRTSLDVWRDVPNSPILWISGSAGTGKTTFARMMAQYWEDQGYLAANFFFSRSSEGKNTPLWFCKAILGQLFPDRRMTLPTLDQLAGQQRASPACCWLQVMYEFHLVRSPSKPTVFIIDALDACDSNDEQVELLAAIMISVWVLDPSLKFLILSRPEQHIKKLFQWAFPDNLPSITLGDSIGDDQDIRMFLQKAFERITLPRLKFNAISITDGSWPSNEVIDELVYRACGQFSFVASVVDAVDSPNQDPVKVLNRILEYEAPSFKALDEVYIQILEKVQHAVAGSSPQLGQLMCDFLLHINWEPSSSSDIAEFWFTGQDVIDNLVENLDDVVVEHNKVIRFRHESFRDFMSRPSIPNQFSLPGMNPLSKIFFFLRKSARISHSSFGLQTLDASQWLAYTFLNLNGHPPVPLVYEEEARRLHEGYVSNGLVECKCMPKLWGINSLGALRGLTPCDDDWKKCIVDANLLRLCGVDDRKKCIVKAGLLILCRMMEMHVDHFKQEWKEWERTQPISSTCLKYLLWSRAFLAGQFDPLLALGIVLSFSSLNDCRRNVALGPALCFSIWALGNTRVDLAILTYLSYLVATLLLHQFLRFDFTLVKHADEFGVQWPSSLPPQNAKQTVKRVRR